MARRQLEGWDQQLESRRYLVRDTLSLADITLFTIFPALHHLAGLEIPAERPHARRPRDRVAGSP